MLHFSFSLHKFNISCQENIKGISITINSRTQNLQQIYTNKSCSFNIYQIVVLYIKFLQLSFFMYIISIIFSRNDDRNKKIILQTQNDFFIAYKNEYAINNSTTFVFICRTFAIQFLIGLTFVIIPSYLSFYALTIKI